MTVVSFGTYTLDAPDSWTLQSVVLAGPVDEAPTKGMLTTKAVKPFQRNLVTTFERVDAKETLQSYLQKQAEGLRQAGVTRQEARPPETVAVNGHQGVLTEQVVSYGGERVHQLQLLVFKDGIAHLLIASHLDGPPFEAARNEFRSMLLSFA